jgi:hypothetical protein
MLSYSLVVSRGYYVRLVRQGQRASQPRPAPLGPPPDWEDMSEHDQELDWDIHDEQSPQRAAVIRRRLRVRGPPAELLDEVRQVPGRRPERDDRGRLSG